MSQISQADQLRIFTDEKIKSNYDFTVKSKRVAAINEFIEKFNKDLPKEKHITFQNVRPHFNQILDQQLENKGIDPKILGRKSKKPKFNTDMNAKINPQPQAGNLDESKGDKSKPITATTQAGAPVIPAYTPEAVGATFAALVLAIKSAFPAMKLLTPDQEKSLGTMWMPAFNIYMKDEKMMIIGVPLIATIGMILPNIIEARKVKKSQEESAQVPDSNTRAPPETKKTPTLPLTEEKLNEKKNE